MSPDVPYMREFIANRYPGERWKDRVANMEPSRVIAIYYRMIEEKPKPEPEPPPLSPSEIKENSDDPPTLF